MITNREMFCTIFGAVSSDKRISISDKRGMSYMIGLHFGIPRNEVKEILDELDKTLEYAIKDLNKNGFLFDRKKETGV